MSVLLLFEMRNQPVGDVGAVDLFYLLCLRVFVFPFDEKLHQFLQSERFHIGMINDIEAKVEQCLIVIPA